MFEHPRRQMSRAMRLLAGLVLFAVPLAAQRQPQQPPRRGNPATTRVPAPPAGRFNELVQRPPQPAPPPSIEIKFDRTPVRVGEDSIVTLEPASLVSSSPYVFTVDFGDGASTAITRGRADVAHSYRAAGSYAVSVTVSTVPGTEVFVPTPVVSNNNAPIEVVHIELRVSPPTSTTGEPVGFDTQFDSSDPGIRYRFNFGDGETSGWLPTPEARHVFRRADDYPKAYVEVGRSNGRRPDGDVSVVARSPFVSIRVAAAQPPAPGRRRGPRPTPVPERRVPDGDGGTRDWPTYVVVMLALALLGFGAKRWLFSPRLTLEGHRDPDALSQVVDRQALGINVEIRLHRAVIGSQIRSAAGDAGLVAAVRRTRG